MNYNNTLIASVGQDVWIDVISKNQFSLNELLSFALTCKYFLQIFKTPRVQAKFRYFGIFSGHERPIFALGVSHDGKYVATGSFDKSIKVWHSQTAKLKTTFTGHKSCPNCIFFDFDGQTVYSGGDDCVAISWNLETGEETLSITSPYRAVYSLALSSDRKMLGLGCQGSAALIANPKNGKTRKVFHVDHTVRSVAFTANCHIFAACSDKPIIYLWDPHSGTLLHELAQHKESINKISIDPFDCYLASASDDSTICIWDLNSAKLIFQIGQKTQSGQQGWIRSVAWSANGRILVSGGDDKAINLWDSKTAQLVCSFKEHTNTVFDVTFCRNNTTVISCGFDTLLGFHDVTDVLLTNF